MNLFDHQGIPSHTVFSQGEYPGGHLAETSPTAVGIDIGSGHTRIWASGRGLVQSPTMTDSPLVRRGRIIDPAGLRALLRQMLSRHHQRIPAGAVVVACRPVLAAPDDDDVVRQVLTAVFAPSRLLLTPAIRAAAIGAGAAPGPLLLADIGAHLTEVAVLARGGVTAALRRNTDTFDLALRAGQDQIIHTVAALVRDLRVNPPGADVAPAAARGLVLVGGGATQPGLAARLASATRLAVRTATRPRTAAVHGAGLAALAALRRAAATC